MGSPWVLHTLNASRAAELIAVVQRGEVRLGALLREEAGFQSAGCPLAGSWLPFSYFGVQLLTSSYCGQHK